MLDSIVKIVRGIIQIRGATTGTLIGNTGNGLNVCVVKNSSVAMGTPFIGKLSLNGANVDFQANKNGTLAVPVIFRLNSVASKDIVIKEIIIFSTGGDIRPVHFFSRSALPNGCILDTKANNVVTTYDSFKTTNDVDLWSSLGGFTINTAGSGDNGKGILQLDGGLIIRATGTYGVNPDDYVRFTIRDNLTSIPSLQIICRGMLVNPGEV